MQRCKKCGKVDLLINFCMGCLDQLREHHEKNEEWWDIAPEDVPKLMDSHIREEIVLIGMMRGQVETAVDYYQMDPQSVNWFLKQHRKRLKAKDPEALKLHSRALNRKYSLRLPEAVIAANRAKREARCG